MTPEFAAACGDFLQHYQRDAQLRWSADDRAAQQRFVTANLPAGRWLDWSTAEAALPLLQAGMLSTAVTGDGAQDCVVLAGPVAELLEPAMLAQFAARQLGSRGRLVGIIPCLRDNSPESRVFAELAPSLCWAYLTAEEVTEALQEAGLAPQPNATEFAAIPHFNAVVLKDELGFKGFRKIFDQLEAQGYDPAAVGWGELRFVATLVQS
jgi:hypothetical protein